ncbi:MAG: lactate utilization protein C [Fimbriimonadaceae bacterium]
MGARETVLRAVGPSEGGSAPPAWIHPPGGGFKEFEARFQENGGEIVTEREIASMVGRAWFLDRDLGPLPPAWGEYIAASPWQADLGVTVCDALVPETGSVVISSAPGRGRLTSLAVPTHLVLADRTQLVANLAEAVSRLGNRSAVIVTGPSRSADIEGEMVRGVHGPKRLLLIWR